MERKIYMIIVAGGSGSRMGASMPKQFLELGGKPILRLSIEVMLEACPQARIVTVLPEDHIDYWKDYCLKANFHVPQIIVQGGITRFHSVKNALAKVPEGALVAIHDAVRPLVSPELVRSLIRQADEGGSAVPAVPAVDTLRVLEKKGETLVAADSVLDRSKIYAIQTPQVFWSETLLDAYKQAFDTAFTDDASVVARKGIPLSYVQGERYNLKITTPEDLALAEAILLRRG
ncbi:MAG: 2-C-methyl-D-erythritol 4-phosphate cytidylyltransferase [Bacteroidales bacterium]|nr:2-C-methyl-D-erythritol 4-phosphate cytidylyltransferase [Bacteroidales bacterium]